MYTYLIKEISMAFGKDVKQFLVGRPGKFKELPTGTPMQQALNQQVVGGAQQLLPQLLSNQFDFGPIAQRARTQFAQQTVPSIAERFTAMGEGAQSSPAFAQLLGQAGAGLEEGLASQEQLFGLQQQGLLQSLLGNLLSSGMQPQFERLYRPSQPGFLQSLFTPGGGSGSNYGPLGQQAQGGGSGGGIESLIKLLPLLLAL